MMPANLLHSKSENFRGIATNREKQSSEEQVFIVRLLGRRITFMTHSAIIKAVHRACIEKKKIIVGHYNVQSFNLSLCMPWFYDFLQKADIVHCDGSGILLAAQYLGLSLPKEYRVSYSLLMPKLLEHCNQQGLSLFLLGSQPGNVQKAIESVKCHFPNIKIEGHHGYFPIEDPHANEPIIQQINRMKPNILLVGMGMPRQENWVRLYKNQLDVNAVMIGGAAIDRLAGVAAECPLFLSNAGLEWLYRLTREPKRLGIRYLLGNPAFVLQIALAKYQIPPSELLNVQALANRYEQADMT